MKIFKLMAIALVAMLGFSACEKDCDHDFIEVDHSKDLVGTWTFHKPGMGVALQIKADGSVVSTGVIGHEYWENEQGKIEVENNKVKLTLEEGKVLAGRLEMIPGVAFVIIEEKTGERITYTYCKQDLSKEIIGQWVKSTGNDEEMIILNFREDGKAIYTGLGTFGIYKLNVTSTYKVIGDLLIQHIIEEKDGAEVPMYMVAKLIYTPDGTAYGDIMTKVSKIKNGDEEGEHVRSFLRVKQHLELPGQKYDYIRTYLTNATGLDKDFNAGGFTLNFSKLDGNLLDKMLKTLLFTVEFPDANTIKYSYTYNGETVSASAPIEVDGNKMTVKMDKTRGHFRDIDLYSFQDKDNTQMHFYMSKYAFINYFGNIAVSLLEAKGELDPNDKTAVDAVFNELTEIVKTINVSFIMSKSK